MIVYRKWRTQDKFGVYTFYEALFLLGFIPIYISIRKP